MASWARRGDAGYFRDPITAHGITDALRDAELVTRAAAANGDGTLVSYQAQRDGLVRGLLDVTDKISSFEWDMEEVKEHHILLSREMSSQVDALRALY